MLDKSNNDGLTKEFVGVVVIVEVETVVEELKLGAEAINGGFDTVKSKAMQGRKKKRNREKLKKNDLMEMKLCYSSSQ